MVKRGVFGRGTVGKGCGKRGVWWESSLLGRGTVGEGCRGVIEEGYGREGV